MDIVQHDEILAAAAQGVTRRWCSWSGAITTERTVSASASAATATDADDAFHEAFTKLATRPDVQMNHGALTWLYRDLAEGGPQ